MFPFDLPLLRIRQRYPTLDGVIPKVTTTSVTDTTTATTLGISNRLWRSLPCEGVMVFEAQHTPATASAALPVLVSTSSSSTPIVNSSGTALTGAEITAGNRYFLYYNKRENVIQVMNHYPTTSA